MALHIGDPAISPREETSTNMALVCSRLRERNEGLAMLHMADVIHYVTALERVVDRAGLWQSLEDPRGRVR